MTEHPTRPRTAALLRRVFIEPDTTTIRVIMAVASALYAAGLFLPLHAFTRPAFKTMGELMPAWAWGTVFALHAVGVFWRLFDQRTRVGWAFAIHAYGLALWIFTTGLINSTIGEYTPSTAMEITVILAAFVALIRTGLNDERCSP